ncbi:MAG: LysM peptidoglycan-binding domain-containing protein [Crenarchaeota archaeon]|nr:LysM peptidoglycan-binding domain-containing protein [Thermoproteota archaeon]
MESPDGKIARNLRSGNSNNKINTVVEEDDYEQEIPIINEEYASKNRVVESKVNQIQHRVEKGDSFYGISRKYNTSVGELSKLNGIEKPYNIYIGQIINIPGNNKSNKSIEYTVVSGDNLSSIAKKYNVSMNDIIKENNLNRPYNIYVGQKLKINSQNTPIQTVTTTKSSVYVVKSGDNLSTIAQNNNTTVNSLVKLNNIKKPYNIYVGQKIKLNGEVKTENVAINSNKITSPGKVNTKTVQTTKEGFSWPLMGEVISKFGSKPNGSYNDGINIAGNQGDKIKSTEDGVVSYVGNEIRAYGTIVLIKHDNNWISVYGHCDSVDVSRGDKVKKGQIIGTVGKTGSVNTNQLYFALRKGEKMVDPLKYLKN